MRPTPHILKIYPTIKDTQKMKIFNLRTNYNTFFQKNNIFLKKILTFSNKKWVFIDKT